MLDWFRGVVPLLHAPMNSGEIFSLSPSGEVEWRSPKRVQATGSHEKTISIKSHGGDGQGNATHLWISGNPSKFLQGHNVFGSDDLLSLVYDTYLVICKQFNLVPTLSELNQVKQGEYDVGMIDVNYSFSLPSRSDVLAFIRAMEFKAKTRHGRPSMKGGTLYFGKNSERWAIKLYCKAEEIQSKTGKLPEALMNKGIEAWADNKLRVELRLMGKELTKLNLDKAARLNPAVLKSVFNDYMGRIQMTDQIKLTSDVIEKLPNRLIGTYTLWSDGHDLRSILAKRTYYRQRKDLMEYGINIDIRPCEKASTNVIPMYRILEAIPAQIPDWAFAKKLIHSSAKTA